MPVETLNGMPCQFTAGDTVIFQRQWSDFPNTTHTAKLWVQLAGQPAFSVDGTTSGGYFKFTIPAATTASLAQNTYDWTIRVTEIADVTQVTTAETGQVFILPNPAVAQDPTDAETMVETLQTALASLAATTDQSVSFNGQSFTQASIAQYRQDLVFWQARVIRERAALARAKGNLTQAQQSPRFNVGGGLAYPNSLGRCSC